MLLQNMKLTGMKVMFPTIGEATVNAQIMHISMSADSKELVLGLKFEEASDAFKNVVVKYLLNFSNESVEGDINSLRSAGFKPKSIKSHIDFSFVESVEEYQQVLAVRLEAYQRAGKIESSAAAVDMSDITDLSSKIVLAKHRGKVVGSVRLTVCLSDRDRFELDSSLKLSDKLDRKKTVEVSRLCVAASFENTDLVLGLIERCTEFCIKAGIETAITSCVQEMLPYYKKLGFYPTGEKFFLKTLNNLPHYLLIHQSKTHRSAKGMNPVYWFFAYRSIVKHMNQFGFGSALPWWKEVYARLLIGVFKQLSKKKKR
jgi:predicted GNAT family N-acyltransferase